MLGIPEGVTLTFDVAFRSLVVPTVTVEAVLGFAPVGFGPTARTFDPERTLPTTPSGQVPWVPIA
jgi:hypothetical protein